MIVGLVETVRQPTLPSVSAMTRGPAADGDRLTLAALVAGVWEGLIAGRTTACPVCHGPMEPGGGHGAGAVAGSCGRCGTGLA